jgi:nitric oxide reductase activation protein
VKASPAAEAIQAPPSQPPRLYDFSGFVREDYYAPLPPKPPQEPPRRRIIDIEKEALVLMAEALEALGDAYAVYGFSGYGRDQVDFFVAKEFAEPYDARVQGRIAAIKPHRSTRMGPAIRHAMRKLEQQDARLKVLLLLSDGYPQDYDYGKDRKSKDYGIQDTMMALHEVRLKGIQTFCITVDPAGHDYLREMCPDNNYLVIADVTALPDELPKIYRGLTT